MIRDLKKEIEEYKKLFESPEKEKFLASDIKQIWNLSQGRDHVETLFNSIGNALEAGFMLGYKNGLVDASKKSARDDRGQGKARKWKNMTGKETRKQSEKRDRTDRAV